MDDARPRSGLESAPVSLWFLVLLAVAPFALAAAAYGYGPAAYARPALSVILGWSAIVLSFLGGVRWGLETAEPRPRAARLTVSALFPAAAFAVFLGRGRMPEAWILVGLILLFLAQWLFDHRPDTPARYPKLSTTLTAGACVSLALVLEKTINA